MNHSKLLNFYIPDCFEAGCDEAGRGCLVGPVFAAAVMLPPDFYHPLLNDSKKLSESSRYKLREVIQNTSICFAIGICSHEEIDKINILNASILAMHKALEQLSVVPQYIIIDGNRFKPYKDIPYLTIVKGDGKYMSIAAASILAKTYRDDFMKELHKRFPRYNWEKNKGYPTADHCRAIEEFGQSEFHRKTFKCKVNKQLKLML